MTGTATKPLLEQIRKAATQFRNGRQADAVAIYEDVVFRAGDDILVNIELGHLCNEMDVPHQAAKHYAIAVEAEPDNASYLSFLAVAYQQDGRLEDAFELFEQAVELDPEIPTVLLGLGIHYMLRADNIKARHFLQKAHELSPSDVTVRTNLATTLARLDDYETALKHAEKAVQIDPSNLNAHYTLGRLLAEVGRIEEAIWHFEKTIRKHRTYGAAYDQIARMKRFSAADRDFIDRTEKVLRTGMAARERYCIHYALGKMLDDCTEYDRAFEHYRQANLLQKRDFDIKQWRREIGKVQKLFNRAAQLKYSQWGHPSSQPVFVIGMPRSGTTLMERIIASHPDAAGADELPVIPRLSHEIGSGADHRKYVRRARQNLTAERIRSIAEEYLDILGQGREAASRIVDKLPGNSFNLGFIASLFPNATIIHVIRDPLDTCLSCYFQNFGTIRWANDLGMIAEVYRFYREVMDYWESVLPAGKVVHVRYESLVEDPATEARRVLAACGLPWDPGVLEHHRGGGVVKTASLWQARQPIYKTSRRRWVNYASHVGQLVDALGDYLVDQRDILAEHGLDLNVAAGKSWLARVFG